MKEKENRDIQYRLRLTASESNRLEYCAKITGKSKADILRIGLDKVYSEVTKKK